MMDDDYNTGILKGVLTLLLVLFLFMSLLVAQALINSHNDGALFAIFPLVTIDALSVVWWYNFMGEEV